VRAPAKLYLASSNPGKLDEFRALAEWTRSAAKSPNTAPPVESGPPEIEFALVSGFAAMPEFEENAPTFAENALGKALHYSQLWAEQAGTLPENTFVFADDSGLVVPTLGGEPGVKSARYAGPNATSEQRNAKLLSALDGRTGDERAAHFVCVIALVSGRGAEAIVSARADGTILDAPAGSGGFGYDPVFHFTELNKSFAELSREEKNQRSHRGKAFRRLLALLPQLTKH
jgi:XTP/dITP diphosphohydrolase